MLYAVSERSYFLYHPGLLKSSKTLSMRNEKTDAIILFFIMFFVGACFIVLESRIVVRRYYLYYKECRVGNRRMHI